MRGARTAGGLGALLAVGLFVLGAARCTYSPDFPSQTLRCSTVQSCPIGYSCDKPSNFCYKNGESPSGAAGTGGTAGGTAGAGGHAGAGGATGTAGTGGASGASGDGPAKFVGHWVFDAGSSETVMCTDGSTKMNDLTADYVDVGLVGMTLTASYFCDWSVTVGPLGDATVIKSGQSCTRTVTDATNGMTKFTWHGMTFILRTLDGKTASLNSMISVDYVDDATKTGCGTTVSCMGTCSIKLSGTLTKKP